MGGVKYEPFFLEDVVIIKSGKRLTKNSMQYGDIPFAGASERGNGITAFISNPNNSLDKNILGVNYNGSVGYSFYHPYNVVFSDDVKRIKWREHNYNNKYTLLFLSSIIKQQKDKYAYGYKFNNHRMLRQKIMLPITKTGEINYQYMEDCMREIESQQIYDYLKQIDKHLLQI